MAPPSFADLGAEARDVLLDYYPLGVWRIKAMEIPVFGIAKMKLSHSQNASNQSTFSDGWLSLQFQPTPFTELEAETSNEDYGWRFVQKWNSFQTLVSRLYFGDITAEHGVKLSSEVATNLKYGTINPAVKASCKTGYLNTKVRVGNFPSVPAGSHGLVAQFQNMRIGYKINTDSTPKLCRCQVAGQVFGDDYNLTTKVDFHCDNTKILHQLVNNTFYQKISDRIEMAVSMAIAGPLQSGNTSMSLGMKYAISEDDVLRAKISHRWQLGLSLTRSLSDRCQVTAAVGMDLLNLSSGRNNVGLNVEFN